MTDEDDARAPGDDGGDDEAPAVVVARLRDLGRFLPAGLVTGFGDRPVWFIREEDEELVEIFDHLPEDPMPKGRAHEILKALRAFTDANSDDLQRLLGRAESLVYAFHGDAPLDRVRAAFDEDGFQVFADVVRSGAIAIPEPPAAAD